MDIENGIVSGGVKDPATGNIMNSGSISFIKGWGSDDPRIEIRSDHGFTLNSENVNVGTSQTVVWRTENNNRTFVLPAYIDETGAVKQAWQGCIFVNGMLVR